VVINNDRTEARLSSSTASQNVKDLVDYVTSRVIILMIWKICPLRYSVNSDLTISKYTSLSVFLYKHMTVVLLLHPNLMTIPPVVPVKLFLLW
jgi:hypothetical protein